MEINRNNYEQYFLEAFEGSLDAVMQEQLVVFLEENPDLAEEFESFSLVTLPEDTTTVLGAKDFLKKEVIGDDNADRFYAAWLEGDLTGGQRAETEAFAASDPGRQHQFELMQQTRLEPDMQIRFPRKSSLKRHTLGPVVRRLWYAMPAAAVVLIMAGLFFTWTPRSPLQEMIAEHPQLLQPVETPALPVEVPQAGIYPIDQQPKTDEPAISPQPQAAPTARPQAPVASRQQTSPAEPVRASENRPLLVSRLSSMDSPAIDSRQQIPAGSIEQRTEFAYWSHRARQQDLSDEPEAGRTTTLANLALDRLQKTIPDEIRQVEERISSGRTSLASAALNGLTSLLNVEQERDENGKIVQLAVGNAFQISRKPSAD